MRTSPLYIYSSFIPSPSHLPFMPMHSKEGFIKSFIVYEEPLPITYSFGLLKLSISQISFTQSLASVQSR